MLFAAGEICFDSEMHLKEANSDDMENQEDKTVNYVNF